MPLASSPSNTEPQESMAETAAAWGPLPRAPVAPSRPRRATLTVPPARSRWQAMSRYKVGFWEEIAVFYVSIFTSGGIRSLRNSLKVWRMAVRVGSILNFLARNGLESLSSG